MLVRLATRGSPLARWQANRIAARIAALPSELCCELVVVTTTGDRASGPISSIGGQGVFVKEVQAALTEGRADLAVHSAKDLPAATPEGLVLAAVPERADPRDALIGRRLADLPTGALVATGSPRRRAQLAWLRPDLTFCELRGNMSTRIDKAVAVGAGVVALAALERLGLASRVAEPLGVDVMLPQVGQGALAVECRADDAAMLELAAELDDTAVHRAVSAERAWLAALGGGCSLPVAALATEAEARATGEPAGALVLESLVASGDGRIVLRRSDRGSDAEELGRRSAEALVALAAGTLEGLETCRR